MSRRALFTLVVVTVLAFGLRAWGLGQQVPTGDDIGVALSADHWVLHGQTGPSVGYHPRLRDALTYLSLGLFGPTAIGLKGFSLLLGTLCIPLTGLIAWRLTRNPVVLLIAATLLAFDGASIDYSRQAIQESQTTFFILLGTWLALEATVRGLDGPQRWLVPLSGLSFGLGVSSKFYALPPLVVSVVILLLASRKRRRWDESMFVAASLVGVPALVYLLSYAPWFTRGYGLWDFIVYQRALMESILTHSRTWGFIKFDEPALWFVQPFMGFADFVVDPQGVGHLSVAAGNPLVWLMVLPAVLYSLIVKGHRRSHQLAQAYFWVSYLPLALSPRPVWLLSAIPIVPFAILIVSLVLADLGTRYGMRWVYLYLTAVVVTSLALYPLAVGRALDFGYLRPIVERMGAYGSHLRR